MRAGRCIPIALVLLASTIVGTVPSEARQLQSLMAPGDAPAAVWQFSYDQVWTQYRFSDRGTFNSQFDMSYRTATFGVGGRFHMNSGQAFTFRPEPFSVDVRDGVTVVASDTPLETYRIDQPASLALRKSFGAWDVGTSFAVLRESETRTDPRLEEVEADIFIVSFPELSAERTSVIGSMIGQFRHGRLRLQAGLIDIPVVRSGKGSFERAYTPTPVPHIALGYNSGPVEISGFLDTKRASAVYDHEFSRLSPSMGAMRARVSYQRGIDSFVFDRLRFSLNAPISRRLNGFLGVDRLWSGSSTLRERDFERWQNANLFGEGQPLFSMLPHYAVRAGIRLGLRGRSPWPVELIEADLYREHLFPVERDRYAAEPVGHVSLRSAVDRSVDLYVRIESDGRELYRSETVRVRPRETVEIPIRLFLPDAPDTRERTLRMDVSVVAGQREELVTRLSATLFGPNAWPGHAWQLVRFLTPEHEVIRKRSERLYLRNRAATAASDSPNARFEQLASFLTALGHDLAYIPDATSTRIVDQVRYPAETLAAGGGDCEDLTVLLASSLTAVGIRTAIVDLSPTSRTGTEGSDSRDDLPWGHVFLLVDTGIDVHAMGALGLNEFEAITRVDSDGRATLWIPLEPTVLDTGFDRALSVGARQYYDSVIEKDGLYDGRVNVYDF